MKKLLISIAALALIAIAGSVWWLYNSLDAQVASAIRRYGSEITGVPISLSKATIDPLGGRAALHGLVVGSPHGFKANHALSLGEISMTLDIGSLTSGVIRTKELTIIKPEVTYEYVSGRSNLDVLQHNIERSITKQRGERKSSHPSEPGEKIVIEHLYIKDAAVSARIEFFNGDTASLSIPDMHLQDIGKQSNGMTVGEAVQQILIPIVQQVGATVASTGVNTAGKTIQKGLGAASKTIKDLFK